MKTSAKALNQNRNLSSDPDLSSLRESIRACAARKSEKDERFDKETDALLRMLEKPRQQDEADRIIEGLQNEMSQTPIEDGIVFGAPVRLQTAPSGAAAEKSPRRKLRHPVITVMLLTFLVLLIAATVIIWYGYPNAYGGNYGESIPDTPASLCKTDGENDTGYMLGINGSFLAVYYNGKVQRALSVPVAQLSDYDRKLLQNGIPLADETALRQALEDYTS